MPVVLERLPRNSSIMLETFGNTKWLHDLADWGKSSLAVVVRYWKQTLAYLLGHIKACCSDKSASAICDVEKTYFICAEKVSIDEVSKQVARLSVSLTDEGSTLNKIGRQSKCSPSGESLNRKNCSAESEILIVDETKMNSLNSEPLIDLEGEHVIVLSDDEKQGEISAHMGLSSSWATTYGGNHAGTDAAGRELKADLKEEVITHGGLMVSPGAHHQDSCSTDLVIEKMSSDNNVGTQISQSSIQSEPSASKRKKVETEDGVTNLFLSTDKSNLTKLSDGTVNSEEINSFAAQLHSGNAFPEMNSASNVQQSLKKPPKTSDETMKELVCDTDDNAWKFSFFKPPRRHQTLITKPSTSVPKRQVIQLTSPVENRPGSMRLGAGVQKRFQPPRLDDCFWNGQDNQNVGKLKEVPVCFESPDGYVEIFRPLVLEEFKAQLQSSYQEMASAEEMSCGSLSVLSVERIDDFHVVRFVHDEDESTGSKSLSENDLILLTRQPLRNSNCDTHTVGKVERREKDNKRRLNILAIRLYLQGCSRLNRARKFLTERSKWYVGRIMSITPQLREFQALSSIREIPLLPVILNPVNHPCGQYESRTENLSKLPQPLQQIFKSSYNGSQLRAISLAIVPFDLKKDFELTLVQGTGKTRTIVAIVSGLLAFSQMKDSKGLRNGGPAFSNSSTTNQRISQSAAIARAWQDAAFARQLNEDVESKKRSTGSCIGGRILICAQSNAAVDELVARISSEGLYGCDGHRYKPYLVRVGNAKTVHPNSLPFFIDTLVENRLGEEKRNTRDEKKSSTSADSLTTLRTNLEKLVDRIRYYESKRASLQEGNSDCKNLVEGDCGDAEVLSDAELKEKLRRLYEKKKAMYTDLANVQAREKKHSDEIRVLRHKYRTAILKEAEIVVTTLSGCGGDLYGVCSESTSGHKFISSSENTLFDAVVIDEAAQ
ncbi:UNVERIFIED_CONTAM: putative helicase MAGATAMA 3, partial [Sesamum radiatum]